MHGPEAARLLGLQVRIPPEAWKYLFADGVSYKGESNENLKFLLIY
jgi:hypothetical protein